jgi:hypothetical protein
MDPNLDKPTSFNLPAPIESGNSVSPAAVPEALPQQAEYAAAASATAPAQMPSAPVQNPIVPPPSAMPLEPASADAAQDDNPQVADDADLIEKEWVNKAKSIVEKTREDPYNQNKELNKFKADYMQKRYNKIIKLSE